MHAEVQAQAQRWVGATIADKYRVDAVLGIGGMGAVYRCHHLGLLRDVAVKLLHANFMEDPNVSPRFDREAQSASRLEHPNCIRVTDYGTWTPPGEKSAVKYMVLELLEGADLSDYTTEAMPPARAMELGVQVLRGLEHAHARGVIHRDLKPENVFVTRDHEGRELLKLVDFGLAKVLSGEGSDTSLTRTGMVFGTPHYMSPEQATGMPSDERTDIYAAGIMLWEFLSGRPPFVGDDPISIIRQQVSTPLPPLVAGTPEPLAQLIVEMTVKEPEQRRITAAEARRRLEGMQIDPKVSLFMNGATIAASGAPAGSQAGRSTVASLAAPIAQRAADGAQQIGKAAQDMGAKVGLSPRAVMGISGTIGALVLVAVVAVMFSGGEGEADAGTAATGVDSPAMEVSVFSGVSGSELEEVDKLIEAQDDAGAQAKLDALIREHPEVGALHLRRGLLFARQEGRVEDAIKAFDRALELEPDAIEDQKIFETVLRVIRDPKAGPGGLELALTRLDERVYPYLIEVVNRREGALGYKDRHRILATLAEDEDSSLAVDQIFNRTLDLWQADQSGKPCETYAQTLEAMEAAPDAYYVGSLVRSRPPDGVKVGSKTTSETGKDTLVACPGLEKRRSELADAMAVRYPEAAKKREVPPDYASVRKKSRSGSSSKSSGKRISLKKIFQ